MAENDFVPEKIPKCMSTQHPDNVHTPFFAADNVLGGEDEIQEAYYVFSHLGCDEQMWDCEGKEVDNFVVKKLLTKYESFFKEKVLGKDVFLTLRVPNPTVEKAEAKILLETLESIPRSFDAAKIFYGEDIAPVFEVILPMTASSLCIDRVYRYYSDFVVRKQEMPFREGDISIKEWIGEFKPDTINVIPLFEDIEHMLHAPDMVKEYLKDKDVPYQRVFLARSDPALNYGMLSAVLLNKIALFKLAQLEEEIGVRIYPIIGVGSAPFRGNLKPDTIERVILDYPNAQTFTIQSAFKYDHPHEKVREAVNKLMSRSPVKARQVDEEKCLEIVKRYSNEYRNQVRALAPVVNRLTKYIPSRRKRKLHIGLFGYSRSMGGVVLPRAITYTAALYSIGFPPEIIAINALREEDLSFITETYINFSEDLKDALAFYNPSSLKILPEEISSIYEKYEFPTGFQTCGVHLELTDFIIKKVRDSDTENLGERIIEAANVRKFLG